MLDNIDIYKNILWYKYKIPIYQEHNATSCIMESKKGKIGT